MMEKEKIDRINELARKKKAVGLTADEHAEHQALHKEYIQHFRAQFTQILENTVVEYPDGSRTALPDLKNQKKNK